MPASWQMVPGLAEECAVCENVNVRHCLNGAELCLCAQIVARGMKARGSGGTIVNVSSQASQCALRDHAVYCKYQKSP